MVIAAFPLAKIGLLLLKQLSKPVATLIKNEAKKHPQVRKYIIVPTGRAYRWIEDQAQIRVKGVKPQELERLTEDEAVELGSNAIGEIILFGLLSILVVAEYNRQGDKKAVIQKTKEEEIFNLQEAVLGIMEEIDHLKKAVDKIEKDLKSSWDALTLEEFSHTFVHDHNFWDVLIANQSKSKKNKTPEDSNSPSI